MEPHLYIKASERHPDCTEYIQVTKLERSLRRVLNNNNNNNNNNNIIVHFLFVRETSQQSNSQLQKQQNTNAYKKE